MTNKSEPKMAGITRDGRRLEAERLADKLTIALCISPAAVAHIAAQAAIRLPAAIGKDPFNYPKCQWSLQAAMFLAEIGHDLVAEARLREG
jgi:hypothetical protein